MSGLEAHIYTTDVSALELASSMADKINTLIVPANRLASEKVKELIARSPYPVFVQSKDNNLQELPPADVAVVWMYSQIFQPSVLERYRHGMMNMHGGKIPDYRGASVLQWAIINGETALTVTWHQIVEEVDSGAIWAESDIPIGETDTAADIRTAMIREGIRLFPEAWGRMLEGTPARIPDLTKGKVWPQRRPSDGRFVSGLPEKQIRDLVRALCPPWPAAEFVGGDEACSVIAVSHTPAERSIAYPTAEGRTIHLIVG